MKRSATIHLSLMATMALVACGGGRQCVDENGRVVPDSFCETPPARGGYHWFYGGGRAFVSGGSRTGASAPSSHGVSRGGFGSTGGGHAGA